MLYSQGHMIRSVYFVLSLQPHRRPDDIGVNDTWHDEVDLSLCFEDTAILYAICVIFWLLAALRFVLHTKQPPLPCSKLSVTKIVSNC